jgi:predicted Rdx family selenoprotein
MKVVIEYKPTEENVDYVCNLEIDIIQRLSAQDLLHVLGVDRTPETAKRTEDVFEIKIDDEIIFDKQTLGRLPNGEEIVNYIVSLQ